MAPYLFIICSNVVFRKHFKRFFFSLFKNVIMFSMFFQSFSVSPLPCLSLLPSPIFSVSVAI